MSKFAPRSGPYGAAKLPILMAEKVVFGKQFVVNVSNLEVVKDLSVTDGAAAIGVPPDVRCQVIKHIAPDQHEPSAAVLNLERLVRMRHAVPVKFVQGKDAGQLGQVFVQPQRAPADALPIETFHGHWPDDDALVSLNHAGHIVGAEPDVSIAEQKMGGICLQEMMSNRVPPPLDQRLVAQKDGGQLVTIFLHRLF